MSTQCMECMRGFPCLNDIPCKLPVGASNDDSEESETRPRHKRDSALKDQQSTGRKRAAVKYPLDRSAPCQWRNASSENPMGGGEIPVSFGCDNLQQCRHHGPDYSTLNNEKGNVWLICTWHHNNWHALNNPSKDANYLKLYGH